MERSEKSKISNILLGERGWHDVNDVKPEVDEIVIIRLTNENFIYGENDTEIYYAEDIKLGRYCHDTETWTIEPPYPAYDYSPLSNKGNLNEGTVVTHWAEASDEAIDEWRSRFSLIRSYKDLRLEVDPEHEEDVYRALLWGAAFMSTSQEYRDCEPGTGIRKLHEILCDLQYCIDTGSCIKNGEVVPNDDAGLKEALNSIQKARDILCDDYEEKHVYSSKTDIGEK